MAVTTTRGAISVGGLNRVIPETAHVILRPPHFSRSIASSSPVHMLAVAHELAPPPHIPHPGCRRPGPHCARLAVARAGQGRRRVRPRLHPVWHEVVGAGRRAPDVRGDRLRWRRALSPRWLSDHALPVRSRRARQAPRDPRCLETARLGVDGKLQHPRGRRPASEDSRADPGGRATGARTRAGRRAFPSKPCSAASPPSGTR